jgi:hypothetical protein
MSTITECRVSFNASLKWRASTAHPISETVDEKTISTNTTKSIGTGVANANVVWHDNLPPSTIQLSALPRSLFGVAGGYAIATLKCVSVKNSGTASATVSIPACGISSMAVPAGTTLLLDSPTGWASAGTTLTVGSGPLDVVLIGVGTVEA